jgi:hypothetical protein
MVCFGAVVQGDLYIWRGGMSPRTWREGERAGSEQVARKSGRAEAKDRGQEHPTGGEQEQVPVGDEGNILML